MEHTTQRCSDGSVSDSSRRRFVKGAGAAATAGLAGLAGCSGILGGGGGPKAPIRSFVQAASDGDAETANGQLHPEGNVPEVSQTQLAMFETADVSVDSMEVLEQSEGRADVEVTVAVSAGQLEDSTTSTWQVRKHEGNWLIYSASMA